VAEAEVAAPKPAAKGRKKAAPDEAAGAETEAETGAEPEI